MWKVLSFASLNLLGPVVFVEVGALIIKEGTTANIVKRVENESLLIFFFSSFADWVGHNNQKHYYAFLGGGVGSIGILRKVS